MQENTLPWVIKLIPAIVGAILALVLLFTALSMINYF